LRTRERRRVVGMRRSQGRRVRALARRVPMRRRGSAQKVPKATKGIVKELRSQGRAGRMEGRGASEAARVRRALRVLVERLARAAPRINQAWVGWKRGPRMAASRARRVRRGNQRRRRAPVAEKAAWPRRRLRAMRRMKRGTMVR
jgi:hypothetical protein